MLAAAGIIATEPSSVGEEPGGDEPGGSVNDDPQPDRVSTADSGVITRRLLTQLEFISYTSVEVKDLPRKSRAAMDAALITLQFFFNR
jgi:hypothetical protein